MEEEKVLDKVVEETAEETEMPQMSFADEAFREFIIKGGIKFAYKSGVSYGTYKIVSQAAKTFGLECTNKKQNVLQRGCVVLASCVIGDMVSEAVKDYAGEKFDKFCEAYTNAKEYMELANKMVEERRAKAAEEE